jgi:hypothetical protein
MIICLRYISSVDMKGEGSNARMHLWNVMFQWIVKFEHYWGIQLSIGSINNQTIYIPLVYVWRCWRLQCDNKWHKCVAIANQIHFVIAKRRHLKSCFWTLTKIFKWFFKNSKQLQHFGGMKHNVHDISMGLSNS